MKSKKPLYLLQPGDPIIEAWQSNIELFKKQETKTVVIDVSQNIVNSGDRTLFQELLAVLQHYPDLIPKFLFSLEFKFNEVEGSDLYFPEEVWIKDPAVQKWFQTLSSQVLNLIFFLNVSECRMFCIAGDILVNEKVKSINKTSGSFLQFSGNQVQTLCDRLFTSCWFMMMYCHNTGFDPTEYVKILLAEFDLPITFEDIKKKYEEDIDKGMQFRMTTSRK